MTSYPGPARRGPFTTGYAHHQPIDTRPDAARRQAWAARAVVLVLALTAIGACLAGQLAAAIR